MAYLKGIGLETSTADFSRRARRGTQLSPIGALGAVVAGLFNQPLTLPVASAATVIDPMTGAPVNPANAVSKPAVTTSASAPIVSSGPSPIVKIAIAGALGVGLFVYLKRRRK